MGASVAQAQKARPFTLPLSPNGPRNGGKEKKRTIATAWRQVGSPSFFLPSLVCSDRAERRRAMAPQPILSPKEKRGNERPTRAGFLLSFLSSLFRKEKEMRDKKRKNVYPCCGR